MATAARDKPFYIVKLLNSQQQPGLQCEAAREAQQHLARAYFARNRSSQNKRHSLPECGRLWMRKWRA
jgi:hypothetical protein